MVARVHNIACVYPMALSLRKGETMEVTKRSDGIRYLTRDINTGEDISHLKTPCSRYGRDTGECAPVAWRVAYLVARDTGTPITVKSLDHAMDLVVNNHDDVAHLVRNNGHYMYR